MILVGNGFYLPTALSVGGVDAEGTLISAGDLSQVFDIQTDGSLEGGVNAMNVGDSIVVDTNDDGDFSDETPTTQTDNDRYTGSTITYADGSTSNATLELISLSDGTQAILVNGGAANRINAASDQIQSITPGTFSNTFEDRYNQANFNNTITNTVHRKLFGLVNVRCRSRNLLPRLICGLYVFAPEHWGRAFHKPTFWCRLNIAFSPCPKLQNACSAIGKSLFQQSNWLEQPASSKRSRLLQFAMSTYYWQSIRSSSQMERLQRVCTPGRMHFGQ